MFLTQVIPAEFLLRGLESGHIPPTPYILAYESIFLRNQFIMIILFWVTIWLVKASFLAFYRQLFTRQFFGWQRSAWWIVVFFTVSTWIANFVLQFFVCVPFKSYFTLGEPPRCTKVEHLLITSGACNSPRNIAVSNDSLYFATASDIFTDLLSEFSRLPEVTFVLTDVVMALPLTIIPQLQMDVKTKAALASLFLTGFIIILFAILRLVFTIPKNGHVNPKWLAIWSTTEMCIAIAVSIAPTFRKYFVARNRGVAIGEQGAPQINRDPPMVVSADTEEGK